MKPKKLLIFTAHTPHASRYETKCLSCGTQWVLSELPVWYYCPMCGVFFDSCLQVCRRVVKELDLKPKATFSITYGCCYQIVRGSLAAREFIRELLKYPGVYNRPNTKITYQTIGITFPLP